MRLVLFVSVLFGIHIQVFANAFLSASPSTMSFQQKVGMTSTGYAHVFVNIIGEDQVILHTMENCGSDYQISTTCYGSYSFTSSCDIQVRFQPQKPGSTSCSVQVYGSPSGSTRVGISGLAQSTEL